MAEGEAPDHSAELVPVRAGEDLDWTALSDYLRHHLEGLQGELTVMQFPRGSANLTYRLDFGSRSLVLRRPPFGLLAPGAHDMKRESRALAVLWRHFDRAPRSYLFCDDHRVIGSDFVVMEYRVGEVIWGAIPYSMRLHPDVGRRVGNAVVDALAELHLLDPVACTLESLGKPDGYVGRQVAGWRKRWELVAAPDLDPLMNDIGSRLDMSQPSSSRSSILHNDFKIDNCQFDPTDPDRVASIFDWDMATLGDPLMDLGTLLNYWPDPSDTADNGPIYPDGADTLGLPSRQAIVDRYLDRTQIDVDSVTWYEAFACFRTAVVLQQLHTRFVRGETNDDRMRQRGELVGPMARRAAMVLEHVRTG
jgi:aminoglycoside phosphotransferase (APT) family kinase protein